MATDNEQVTKRERQKQRREAKVAQERRRLVRARRNRLVAVGAVAVLALAALGFVIQGRLAAQQAREDNIAAAAGRLEELGCTAIEEEAQTGAGQHLSADQLASSPPEVIYPERPAASGPHVGAVVENGVFDKQIDERLMVHNLEHGNVNYYYGPDADPEMVTQLSTWAQDRLDDGFPEVLVAPYGEALPDGAQFATVSWGFRQLCRDFDSSVAQSFLDQRYNGEEAPERFTPAGQPGQPGVLDPNESDGPLLLPPLGEMPAEEATEQAPGSTEASGAAPSGSVEASEDGSPAASASPEAS